MIKNEDVRWSEYTKWNKWYFGWTVSHLDILIYTILKKKKKRDHCGTHLELKLWKFKNLHGPYLPIKFSSVGIWKKKKKKLGTQSNGKFIQMSEITWYEWYSKNSCDFTTWMSNEMDQMSPQHQISLKCRRT